MKESPPVDPTIETIASVLSSPAPAAVSVILVQGPLAAQAVHTFWKPNTPNRPLQINRIRYGQWISMESDFGEGVIVCVVSTDKIEVHSHGGPIASKRILDDLERFGLRIESSASSVMAIAHEAPWSEIQLEAMQDLIHTQTILAANLLLDQYSGRLDEAFQSIQHMIRVENFKQARQVIEELLGFAELGLHLIHPRKLLLCGPPNSGKSSLMNSLLGFRRVIVHDTPGTTRDLVMENTALTGLPLRIIDSAGLRQTDNEVENAGIAAARNAMNGIDMALILVDLQEGWTDLHSELVDILRVPFWLIGTKADLDSGDSSLDSRNLQMKIDCRTPESIAPLVLELERFLLPPEWKKGQALPFRQRHVDWLRQCLTSLQGK